MTLHGFLQGSRGYGNTQALGEALKALQREALDCLPLPGSGETLERFSRLAQVAGHDLGLCKLFEGHTDALAIIAELHGPLPPSGSTWGMWAAEPPTVASALSNACTVRRCWACASQGWPLVWKYGISAAENPNGP